MSHASTDPCASISIAQQPRSLGANLKSVISDQALIFFIYEHVSISFPCFLEMHRRSFLAFALALLPVLSNGQTYSLVNDFSGQNLQVDSLCFQLHIHGVCIVSLGSRTMLVQLIIITLVWHRLIHSLTSQSPPTGNVHFVSQAVAVSNNLTYVDSNGHVIIKVDNTTVDTNAGQPFDDFGRNTVYLMSNDKINIGSLLIFDANHIPFGVCPPSSSSTLPSRC